MRRIVILSDGVTGHLRQCEAVRDLIRDGYLGRGMDDRDVSFETVDVNVNFERSLPETWAFRIFHPLFRRCSRCRRCVRFSLSPADLERLQARRADWVISPSGTRISGTNAFFAARWRARSIVLMTPKGSLDGFDLVISPRHDGVPESPRLIVTEGAPNAINTAMLQAEAEKLRAEIPGLRSRCVGLLLGGNYGQYELSEHALIDLARSIRSAAEAADADVLITTSRRTPEHAEQALKREFASDPRCRLLVIANEKNREGVVPAILGLSQAVVVSPESVSMVSEAATSGAHVVVCREDITMTPKHALFLENLSLRGHIHLVDSTQVRQALIARLTGHPKRIRLDDATGIRKRIENLLG